MIFNVTMVIVLEAQQTVPCKQGYLSAFHFVVPVPWDRRILKLDVLIILHNDF